MEQKGAHALLVPRHQKIEASISIRYRSENPLKLCCIRPTIKRCDVFEIKTRLLMPIILPRKMQFGLQSKFVQCLL